MDFFLPAATDIRQMTHGLGPAMRHPASDLGWKPRSLFSGFGETARLHDGVATTAQRQTSSGARADDRAPSIGCPKRRGHTAGHAPGAGTWPQIVTPAVTGVTLRAPCNARRRGPPPPIRSMGARERSGGGPATPKGSQAIGGRPSKARLVAHSWNAQAVCKNLRPSAQFAFVKGEAHTSRATAPEQLGGFIFQQVARPQMNELNELLQWPPARAEPRTAPDAYRLAELVPHNPRPCATGGAPPTDGTRNIWSGTP